MNKAIVLAAALLMGSTIVIAPASATTVAETRAQALVSTEVDPFATRVTEVDDGRQSKRTSFAAVADDLYDLVAPLTFTIDQADGSAALKGAVTNISFTTDHGMVVVKRRPAGVFDATVSDASILPDAATWALMLLGFAMTGLGLRYGIRRSNAKFNQKIRRIAEGLEA